MLFLYFRKFSIFSILRIKAAVLLQFVAASIIHFKKFSLFDLITNSVWGIFSPPWEGLPIRHAKLRHAYYINP